MKLKETTMKLINSIIFCEFTALLKKLIYCFACIDENWA